MSMIINQKRVRAQTTDATPTVIYEWELPSDPECGQWYMFASGRRADNDDSSARRIRGPQLLDSGAASENFNGAYVNLGSPGLTMGYGVSGTKAQITVTGIAGVTVEWLLAIIYEGEEN